MSLIFGDIQGALYKQYADTAALNTLTSTTTSMFREMSDKGEDAPYIVASIVTMVPDYTLGELTRPREEVRVQFTVVDDSKSSATLDSILDQLEAAYGVNATALSFEDSTYTHLASFRIAGPTRQRVSGVWQGIVIYRIVLKKAA